MVVLFQLSLIFFKNKRNCLGVQNDYFKTILDLMWDEYSLKTKKCNSDLLINYEFEYRSTNLH